MKQIFIKKLFLLLPLLMCILFVSGCDKLKICIYTKINKDGSALRRIEYIFTPSNEDQLKYINNKLPDLLEKGYILPREPEWTIQQLIKDDSFHFIAEKTFASINELKSDYYKKSKFNGASQNFVSFDMTERGDSIDYNFLEVYRDSSDIVKFSRCFTEYIKTNRSVISKKLFKTVSEVVKDFSLKDGEKVIDIFIEKAEKFNNIVNKFNIIGPSEKKIIENEFKELNKGIKIDAFIDYLNEDSELDEHSTLIELFHLEKAILNAEQKQELFRRLKNLIKEEFLVVAQANNVDPLGAYYTDLDMLNVYNFEYKLEMPGTVTNTNGNIVDDNTFQWNFKPDDFFNHDYVIIVKSVLVEG
ncbi:MAG: hypothetical protein AB1782_07840 [Cyanobacteriota bacterium]